MPQPLGDTHQTASYSTPAHKHNQEIQREWSWASAFDTSSQNALCKWRSTHINTQFCNQTLNCTIISGISSAFKVKFSIMRTSQQLRKKKTNSPWTAPQVQPGGIKKKQNKANAQKSRREINHQHPDVGLQSSVSWRSSTVKWPVIFFFFFRNTLRF